MPQAPGARQLSRATTQNSDRSTGRAAFYARVYHIVSRVPRGRVTTYGTIARALGMPQAARSVGWALSVAPDGHDLPCHRVVNHEGFLSGGWHWGHPDVMAGLLRDEGVPFLAPHRVDLARCLWLPEEDEDHGAGYPRRGALWAGR